ncbi:hypothetical protein [Pontibacter chinhatensis]|uniref:hypothetical protein n=1 Tax=Pontibacter chinhatensis TaxID=1436961 RepID=UPI000B841872|nr:hypothetical protein [Pontibacter chinhatensis]
MKEISFKSYYGLTLTNINWQDSKGKHPIFIFGDEACIMVECSWRLLKQKKFIHVGQGDFSLYHDNPESGKRLEQVIGGVIVEITYELPPFDIKINFGNEYTLDIVADSSQFENWQFIDHSGKRDEFISFAGGGKE